MSDLDLRMLSTIQKIISKCILCMWVWLILTVLDIFAALTVSLARVQRTIIDVQRNIMRVFQYFITRQRKIIDGQHNIMRWKWNFARVLLNFIVVL